MRAINHNVSLAAMLIACGSALVSGQPAQAGVKVEGFRGTVELKCLQPEIVEIHVDQTSAGAPGAKFKYVIQLEASEGGAVGEPAWKGEARLLVSDGLVALIGTDGTKRMYKFPEVTVPPSLVRYDFEPIPVYGIARYDEPSSSPTGTATRSVTPQARARSVLPMNVPSCPAHCTSGGEGSLTCTLTSGGFSCNVSCSAGFYACCWFELPNAPVCRCCKG